MKLKRIIQIIQYSNYALLIGLLVVILAFVFKSPDNKVAIFEMLFGVFMIISFLFRKIMVAYYFKRTPYPGVFYSVLDKLGFMNALDINLTDELLSEMYNPAYSTEQFLKDNDLSAEIGKRKFDFPGTALIIILGIVGFVYFERQNDLKNKNLLLISCLAMILVGTYFWIKAKRDHSANEPIVRFTDSGLIITQTKIAWKDIYDWNYLPEGKHEPSYVIINYYDSSGSTSEERIALSELNSSRIEFYLLLTHFKAKYGQQ